MSEFQKATRPVPIDLTIYEDYLLDLPDVDRRISFGTSVQVESEENGKIIRRNLWETANPQGALGEDGFLSYEEARGKIFTIPMAFCNSPGTLGFEVKSRSDFRELRYYLATPFRIHNFTFHSCIEKPAEPEIFTSLPDPDTMQDLLDRHRGTHDRLTTQVADGLYETFGPAEEISPEQMLNSLRTSASTFASGLAANAVSYSFQMGIEAAFQGAGLPPSSNVCNWELDEELPDHCFEEN